MGEASHSLSLLSPKYVFLKLQKLTYSISHLIIYFKLHSVSSVVYSVKQRFVLAYTRSAGDNLTHSPSYISWGVDGSHHGFVASMASSAFTMIIMGLWQTRQRVDVVTATLGFNRVWTSKWAL